MKSYITGLKNDGTNELLRDVKRAEAAYDNPGQEEVTEYEADNIKKNLNDKNLTQQNDRGETAIKALLKLSSRIAGETASIYMKSESAERSLEKIKEIMTKIDPRIRKEAEKQIAEEQTQTKPLGTFDKAKEKLTKSQAEKNEMLFNSVIKGDTIGIENALAVGANIEARDGKGNTPLMVAAHVYQDQSVLSLIEAGADVNAKNYQNLTALHFSCEVGEQYTSSLDTPHFSNYIEARLIEAGADVNAIDIHGRTPIMVADNIDAVHALKDAGAEVTQKVKDYWKSEDKEYLVLDYDVYEYDNQPGGGYKSEERLREEAAYLSQDQGEDEHEQQGQSA